MDPIRRLEELFARFPGIGPRQARRFVYYIQTKPASATKELADLIQEVKRATSECADCHRFFTTRNARAADNTVCPICADPARDRTSLMVVARDFDLETVERSGAYRGTYFVLGGTVPILDKEPEKHIRLHALGDRVRADGLTEVILSMNATPDGENTAEVVRKALSPYAAKGLKVTILGRGLSTGAELEYVDGDTIKSALQNRH